MLDYLYLAGNKVSKTVGNVYIETVKMFRDFWCKYINSGWESAEYATDLRFIM